MDKITRKIKIGDSACFKKTISESDIYKRKNKLIGFLMRKGFENELIFKVVNEVREVKTCFSS